MDLKKLAEEWQQQHKLNGGHAIKNVSYESACDGTDCDAACCSYPHQVAALVALLERVEKRNADKFTDTMRLEERLMNAERERDEAREEGGRLAESLAESHRMNAIRAAKIEAALELHRTRMGGPFCPECGQKAGQDGYCTSPTVKALMGGRK